MWRNETGLMEMLLSYIGEFNNFSSWSDWRPILLDILSSHEELRRQRLLDATVHSPEVVNVKPEDYSCSKKESTFEGTFLNDGEGRGIRDEIRKRICDESNAFNIVKYRTNWESEKVSVPSVDIKKESLDDPEPNVVRTIRFDGNIETKIDRRLSSPERSKSENTRSVSPVCVLSLPSSLQNHQSPSENINRQLETHNASSSRERACSCHICGKSFASKANMNVHMRTHSGERPFSCAICSKSFAINSNLKVHMRTHSGEKPYMCPECGKTFAHINSMKAHMVSHGSDRPYVCHLCGKAFAVNNDLKNHLRMHSGVSPHTCDICEKSFATRRYLKMHQLSHRSKFDSSEDVFM